MVVHSRSYINGLKKKNKKEGGALVTVTGPIGYDKDNYLIFSFKGLSIAKQKEGL